MSLPAVLDPWFPICLCDVRLSTHQSLEPAGVTTQEVDESACQTCPCFPICLCDLLLPPLLMSA